MNNPETKDDITIAILGNVMLPTIARQLGKDKNCFGGWISSYIDILSSETTYRLLYFFPQGFSRNPITGKTDEIEFYGFFYESGSLMNFSGIPSKREYKRVVYELSDMFKKERTDILHVFGTEFPYSAAAIEAFGDADRTIVHIQGLVSICAHHYLEGIPASYHNRLFPSNIVRGSLAKQKRMLEIKGEYEKQAICHAGNILGRTEWDKACVAQINPRAKYYKCDELLRPAFYEKKKWAIGRVKRNSIFFSQASSPVKGIHVLVAALEIIARFYPDVTVSVAGNSFIDVSSARQLVSKSAYAHYIDHLLDIHGVRDRITFLGFQNAEQMRENYLRSHVFVSSSMIENSPNSLCEAMALGCPIVASQVGGVDSLCIHEKEAFLYHGSAHYMLAHYVMKLFSDDSLAREMGLAAANRASKRHHAQEIKTEMIEIYADMLQR